MNRCDHCPVRADLPCPAVARPHPRLCELADPSGPDYDPAYIGTIRAMPTAPGEIGDAWVGEDPPPGFPGLMAMAGNFVRSAVAHVADGGRKAPPEVREARKAACEGCPRFDRAAARCSECGCTNMPLKWSWASSRCPLTPPKWDSV